MRTFIVAALVAAAACHASPPVPPPQPDADAAPADAAPPLVQLDALPRLPPCATACLVLQAAGCTEGAPDTCTTALAKMEAGRRKIDPSIKTGDNHMTCEVLAEQVHSKQDARNHGLDCPD